MSTLGPSLASEEDLGAALCAPAALLSLSLRGQERVAHGPSCQEGHLHGPAGEGGDDADYRKRSEQDFLPTGVDHVNIPVTGAHVLWFTQLVIKQYLGPHVVFVALGT